MTVSLAFTSSVNYNSTNFATVLTEFCETWLADRGWSVSPQPTQPTPPAGSYGQTYGWYCEKNITCVDGTTKRYGKIIAATADDIGESSWLPGDPVDEVDGERTDYYEAYLTLRTSEMQGQWKFYTDDTDEDFFLLTVNNIAVAIWPPSGSLYNYSTLDSTEADRPIYKLEPTLIGPKNNFGVQNTSSLESLQLAICSDNSSLEQETLPMLYQYSILTVDLDPLFEDASGLVGMFATGARTGSVSNSVNSLYDEANDIYYIRVGTGDGGSILLNHGSVNPSL